MAWKPVLNVVTILLLQFSAFHVAGASRSLSEQHAATTRSTKQVGVWALTELKKPTQVQIFAGAAYRQGSCTGSAATPARTLKQVNTQCPAGCATGGCVLHSTSGGYKCISCQGSLLVTANGTCACPAGKYGTTNTCADCTKGNWCPGGTYTGPNTPVMIPCSTDTANALTTPGRRATSIRACVNAPGTYFSLDTSSNPVATPCPADTYGPGNKKQRACVPCPPGYTTVGATRQTSMSACVVPEGFYLKGPGQVAPCPKGEFKSGVGPTASCTKCAYGVTTRAVGSTSEANCTVLLPSYFAEVMRSGAIKSAKTCPQSVVCAGGEPTAAYDPSHPDVTTGTTVAACAAGTWTEGVGASSATACMTPPGYKTANSITSPCGEGEYRPGWKPATAASTCNVCGEGIGSAPAEQINHYDPVTGATTTINVSASVASCYIKAGQGMYFSVSSNTYRAANCDTNSYGVSSITYGLSAYPCRDCPAGMQTSTSLPNSAAYYVSNGAGKQGFTSPMACVTKPGYGYNGRFATKCPAGSYNAAGNYDTCSQCPTGLSTPDDVNRQLSQADCTLAVGYGFHDNTIVPCPVGTYNDQLRTSTIAPCTPCPTGLSTSQTGGSSIDDCNLCAPGYGGTSCATQCGGTTSTYGPAERPIDSTCENCPYITPGYFFDYLAINRNFSPAVVARPGAVSAADCLAEFGQISDVAWYMGGSVAMATVSSASTFAACVDACKADTDCQYITFDYVTSQCSKRTAGPGSSGQVVAYKALLAADTTVAQSKPHTKAKGLASGSYTLYWDSPAGIGTSTTDVTTTSFQSCLNACDADSECAAVAMAGVTTAMTTATGCQIIRGNNTVATFKRSVTKVNTNRLVLPTPMCLPGHVGQQCASCSKGFISPGGPATPDLTCTACPAGFTTDGDGASECTSCVPGYAGGGNPNTCSPCPAGLYSNGGPVASTTCTACPAGYTTSGTGSTSADCTQVANAEGCTNEPSTPTGGTFTSCNNPTAYGGTCTGLCNTCYNGTLSATCVGGNTWSTNNQCQRVGKTVFAKISSGVAHACAINNDGRVVCWGENGNDKTIVPAGLAGVTSVSAGGSHTCAARADGSVVCWGDNGNDRATPPADLADVTSVAAGEVHTCASKADGSVVCWGVFGQATVPAGLAGVTSVSAARKHTCVIKADRSVVCWAYSANNDGQATVPAGLADVTSVSAGAAHTCATKADGSVVCWGDNSEGQATVPAGLTDVTSVSAGWAHTCASKADGRLVCWGYNGEGQASVPAGLVDVTSVSVGRYHTCVIKADGSVVCWGYGLATIPPC